MKTCVVSKSARNYFLIDETHRFDRELRTELFVIHSNRARKIKKSFCGICESDVTYLL